MMMNAIEEGGYAVHQECWESLPWLVNGSLDDSERARLRGHLAGCVTCRAELVWLERLGGALRTSEQPDFPASPAFDTLMARIDREAAAARRPSRWAAALRRLRATLAATPAAVRWALGAQAVLAAVLAAGLALFAPEPEPAFRLLASPTPAARTADLRVVFDEALPEGELRAALLAVGGRIVDGPGETGVYSVALGGRPAGDAASALRGRSGVRFAEPASRPAADAVSQ